MKRILFTLFAASALSTAHADHLVINELMASNAGVVMSPATNFDSWIELYNPTAREVNLAGMYLSRDPNNLTFWQMPQDMGKIPARGFKVVWLGSNDIKSNQAPFKLDCDGGTLCLSDKNGQLITSVDYPEAMSRTAWARTTDGGDAWGWTATPTPGATNTTSTFASQRLAAPVVSQGSQLFQGSLSIKVDIPEGAKLMYTTDGSMPQETTSASSSTKRSRNGQFTITRTTNYVFRLFKDGYLPSVPVTRSYIVPEHEYTIPIISIVGDERYFTDAMWGIDVKGTNGITGNGSDEPVNWNQPWDRPVNFSYISPTEGMLFNQDVNIAVSGGWTRTANPRSMKLKSNKVFDGQNRFDYVFFPQKPYIRSKTLLVRNGGNDVWSGSRFMDPALQTIIQRSGIDIDVQSFVQVVEYVNGRFKGVLNLREPNNDKFVYANFGYDDEEIDMFENDTFTNGTDEAYNHLVELSENINQAGIYDEVKTLLDIDEFTNYMAAELYLGNDDWPDNNVKGYRSQADGRFRFVLFDLDYAFNAWDHRLSSLDGYSHVKMVRLFKNLLKHDEYRKKFIDTFCIMAGSVFEKSRATAIINELADSMRPMSQLDGMSPDNSANKIKEKLTSRMDDLTSQLQQYQPMQLSGVKKHSIQFAADVDGASIYVNGIPVPYADFNGKLFAPVQLEAKAPAGYTFSGWQKSSETSVGASSDADILTSAVIDVTDSNISLTALFTPLSAEQRAAQGLTPVRINEVSAANDIYVNEFFKRNDWVELYNTTDQPIDVEGMFLSDNLNKPKKYQISKSTTQTSTIIPAHGYLIVWCDKLDPLSQLHASFKLDADGGDVLLTAADERWTDRLTYTMMTGHETVGRYPDGSQQVFTMNIPTIAKCNVRSSYLTEIEQPAVPTAIADIPVDSRQPSHQIYNLHGQALQGALAPGIYIKNGRKFIKK